MTTAQPARSELAIVPEPMSLDQLGIEMTIVRDLVLKMLYSRGRASRAALGDDLKVSPSIVQEIMELLTQEGLATVLGASARGTHSYVYTLSNNGRAHAEAALARSGYIGPVPVTLAEYVANVHAMSVHHITVTHDQIAQSLAPLVLADQTLGRISRGAASRRPMLVFGPSGNGKTTAVKKIGRAIGGTIDIPFAIETAGQIIRLFDALKHERVSPAGGEPPTDLLRVRPDQRWLRINRPVIWAGGELTRRSLELVYDNESKVYEAPLQLKANGGTLIIDDFGRQQMPAVQLLNRWIGALDAGIDHLTMHNGQLLEVPFDVLVLFSTNLTPGRLADEAFLRRIRHKVEIPNPTEDEFRKIFHQACENSGIAANEDVTGYLLEHWYTGHDREFRGCHAQDIIDAVIDTWTAEGAPTTLTREMLDEGCATYFLRSYAAPA